MNVPALSHAAETTPPHALALRFPALPKHCSSSQDTPSTCDQLRKAGRQSQRRAPKDPSPSERTGTRGRRNGIALCSPTLPARRNEPTAPAASGAAEGRNLPRKRQRPEKADNRRNGPHTFPGLHHTPSARRHPTHAEATRSRDPDSAEAKSLVLSSTSLPLTAETMRLLLASLRHHHLAETRGSSRSGYAPAALTPAETSTTRRAQTDGPESAPAFRGLHPAGIRYSHAGGLDRRAARGSLGLPPSRVVSLKAATRLSPNLPSWPLLLRGANDPKHRTFRVSTASSLAGLSPDCRPSWASSPPDTHQR